MLIINEIYRHIAGDDDDDDDDDDESNHDEEEGLGINPAAQGFMDDNKTESTYKNYQGNLKLFRDYIVEKGFQSKYLTSSQSWAALDLPKEIVKCFDKEKMKNLESAVVVNFISDRSILTKGKRNGQTRSYESCSLSRSACKHLLKKLGLPPPYSWELPVSECLRGMKRSISQKKLTGAMPLIEGKAQLPVAAYKVLNKIAMQAPENHRANISNHLFTVMQWNLIARSISVSSLKLSHFKWETDCLQITLPMHKGDQDGSSAAPKHLFANPDDPASCPILALAIWFFALFVDSATPGVAVSIFQGAGDAEERYNSWLQNVLKEGAAEFQEYFADITRIASHSLRKGAAVFAASAPGGPDGMSIFLRAGWSIGQVVQRYLLLGDGKDNFLGRFLVGLPLESLDFARLPPHFKPGALSRADLASLGIPAIPLFDETITPYLLAQLVYHYDPTTNNLTVPLHASHPLLATRVFSTGLLRKLSLSNSVVAGCFRCPFTGMSASGIPPWVNVYRAVKL